MPVSGPVCGYRIRAIMSACHADDAGSSPAIRSYAINLGWLQLPLTTMLMAHGGCGVMVAAPDCDSGARHGRGGSSPLNHPNKESPENSGNIVLRAFCILIYATDVV